MEYVKKEYSGCIDGSEPTDVYIAVVEGTAIGMIQSYRVSDYPEHALSVKNY